MPLSLLSSAPGAVSPPRVKIGSSTVIVVELTVVVVPFTVKLPETVRLSSTSTVPPAESSIRFPLEVSISFVPPTPTCTLSTVAAVSPARLVEVPPREIEVDPTVTALFARFAFGSAPVTSVVRSICPKVIC